MLNLDTHILLFALTGAVKHHERELLSQESWSIAAIVLWEIAKLAQLGRIELDLRHPRVLAALETTKIWPLDIQVCQAVTRLDFHSDPADELIAATSLTHGLPLLTRDRTIRSSKIVPLANVTH